MHRSVINILKKVLVNHFYKVHIGFFFFGFFILFGVVAPGQVISYHLSLIQGMIQSKVFLSCVIATWLLYTFKCINYTLQQLKDPRQLFLFPLNTLPQKMQYGYLLFVHLLLYMPVLVYAVLVAIVAAKQHFFWSMTMIIISNVLMIAAATFLYMRCLQKKNFSLFRGLPKVHFPMPRPLFSIPLWFLWKERKQMLLVTKLFTILLLYGFINIYEPDHHDIRPLLLILMLVGVAHSAIVFQLRSFEDVYLSFSRNLPIPITRRFMSLFGLYLLLLLPELVFSCKAYPLHFLLGDFPQLLLLAVSLPVFFHSLLLMDDFDTEGYIRVVSGTAAVLFFLILYDPGIVLPVFILGISFVFFSSHFYTFEKRYI